MSHIWVGSDIGTLHGINLLSKQNTVVSYGNEPCNDFSIRTLTWNPDYTDLLCTLKKDLVNVFNVPENIYVNQYEVDGGELVSSYALDGDQVLTCTMDGKIGLWCDDEPKSSFKIGKNIECCVKKSDVNFITGGKENDLKVWDIETEKNIFAAKNVPRDFLDLRVPIWIRSISPSPSSPHVIATGTNYHQYRLYDTRAKRRPVLDINWEELPIISLLLTAHDQAYLGNGRGDLACLDMRSGKGLGKFRGLTGSCRNICIHPTEPLLASVSLDRYLRVHDIKTRELRYKFYLKYKLNCVMFSNEAINKLSKNDTDVWDTMEETVTEVHGNKRFKKGEEN